MAFIISSSFFGAAVPAAMPHTGAIQSHARRDLPEPCWLALKMPMGMRSSTSWRQYWPSMSARVTQAERLVEGQGPWMAVGPMRQTWEASASDSVPQGKVCMILFHVATSCAGV